MPDSKRGGNMRAFRIKRPEAGGSIVSFYCRNHNRVVGGCPLDDGPDGCPLRRECPAYGGQAAGPAAGDPRGAQS
jgi:hypothetical protein